jgi:hypothetical protein
MQYGQYNAIAGLGIRDARFTREVFSFCSRLWNNRANGGDICGVANGPPFVFMQVSSS